MRRRAAATGPEATFASPRTMMAGNRLTLLRDGREAFPAMLSAIDGAAHTAHLETYILKILAVDGKVAFVGGLNIADAYAPTEDGGEGWRDNHARIEGPSAARLDDEFLENTP